MTNNNKLESYLSTSRGRALLSKHSLSESGVWAVFGEDPNCDFHGNHHEPLLGYFEGDLSDVIRHAVNISGFWTWGAGGTFSKVVPFRVT